MYKLLVVTPIAHIRGLREKLASKFDLLEYPDPLFEDVVEVLPEADVIFTNPNKSKLPIDSKLQQAMTKLKVITTASTGLIHIDLIEAGRRGVEVISLTKELATIEKISSTAEHALALTLSALRRVPWSFSDVLDGNWDYEKFIGRQIDHLTVGVVGYGRLGKMYARYAQALGAEVLVCDPAYGSDNCPFPVQDMAEMVPRCDIISLHIHATSENLGLIGSELLASAREDLLLVNTSRGEVVDEKALQTFLGRNPGACYATDVLASEQTSKWDSPIYGLAKSGGNVLITPHTGGMTREAQEIAYHRVADMLIECAESL
ncbi:NAD(P)-dependent oxidoreductase [Desulfovibrio ferrophilus]|uniref:4-phosphoerythronate dehydrogenase n=1 Tax=Desulfovibrio ferrophilus TaxID=241368 RepID=A0A2Z6B2B8_9BACT|nr:D-isomer specific 2-hydroxyacid dehydrogenase family protein [Desulfovibrio ferrophilus]BBD09588.1 4-phosphoerythronate dehydrogenase [Desulfovibrio ferrophilus]